MRLKISSSPAAGPTAEPDHPVVAILTIDDDVQLFRGNRQNFADLIDTGRNMGVTTYVVTVNELKLNAPRVLGYTFRKDQQIWVQDWFPRPHVVYNRIPQREDERLPRVKRKLANLAKHPEIRLFNRRFFNKWSLFQWLYAHPSTRRYIPDTKKLTSPSVLAYLLKRHRLLYLKPVRGKAGVGIMTVKVQPEKHLPYKLQIQDEKGKKTYRCASMQRLWNRICQYIDATGETYIAQQGIQLVTTGDRPFDLRVLAQKNQFGKWDLTGIGARVAGSTSLTTHVPRGGNIDDPEKLLTSFFGREEAARVMEKVRNAVLKLARQIEKSSRYRLGEMSMDLGVDKSGNIWFLEANSKPMKFDESDIRRQSLQRIFQYSQYLYRRSKRKVGG